VVELSPTGQFIQSITVGLDPHGLKIDRANSGNIWSQNQGGAGPGAPAACPGGTTGTVTALAPNGTVVGSFCTQGDLPQHAQFDASDNIWVTNQGSNTISELVGGDVGIGTFVASFPTGVNPHAVARDQSGNFWIANYGSADITVLNSSGALVSTIPGVGAQPTGNDINPSANLWQSVQGLHVAKEFAAAPSFVQIDGDHNVGDTPRGVTIDNAGNVFVANQNSENVFEFDSSGTFVRELKVGRGAENMAINSKGDLWVTNAYDNTVSVLKKVAVPTPNSDDDSNG
jgi:streptogramin lyase